MKKIVAVTYQFIFSPADTSWSNLYEIDKSLSDFFAAHGLAADVVEPIKGAPGGRTLYIYPIEVIPPPVEKQDERRKQPGSQLKDMAERKLRAPALAFKAKK